MMKEHVVIDTSQESSIVIHRSNQSHQTTPLTIGALAKAAQVNIATIRYYERTGLIDQPDKPTHGFRHYPVETLDRVLFIKKAQTLGFTLKEIQRLLEIGDGQCHEVQGLAEQKLALIHDKIDDLNRLAAVLTSLIKQCQSNSDDVHCPIVGSLLEKNP